MQPERIILIQAYDVCCHPLLQRTKQQTQLVHYKKRRKKKKNCMEDIITKLKNVSQFPKA